MMFFRVSVDVNELFDLVIKKAMPLTPSLVKDRYSDLTSSIIGLCCAIKSWFNRSHKWTCSKICFSVSAIE